MDFDLNDDQQLLMSAFDGLLTSYRQPPQGVQGYTAYSAALQEEVAASGFLDVASQPGFGLLEGAMLVEAAAACPVGVELGASMLVGPLLGDRPAPLAIAWGLGKPVRYLSQARTVCVFNDGAALVGAAPCAPIEPKASVAAYPMALLGALPEDAEKLDEDLSATIHRRTLIGISAEAAGLMRGALESTVQYVKDRQQFGQPLGHFQAIQHRLAECAQLVRACRWLAFRAANTEDEADVTAACLYAQEASRKVINDCHQFSGAMGLTLEFPLHLWTYRLKVLQGEAGGKFAQGQRLAAAVWE